jgi:uncharacterized membrane protein (DUF485 family)
MKLIKKIFAVFLAYIFILAFPVSAKATDLNLNTAVETGDRIAGIVIAIIAFIVTAFITTKLTKRKNKLNKK